MTPALVRPQASVTGPDATLADFSAELTQRAELGHAPAVDGVTLDIAAGDGRFGQYMAEVTTAQALKHDLRGNGNTRLIYSNATSGVTVNMAAGTVATDSAIRVRVDAIGDDLQAHLDRAERIHDVDEPLAEVLRVALEVDELVRMHRREVVEDRSTASRLDVDAIDAVDPEEAPVLLLLTRRADGARDTVADPEPGLPPTIKTLPS